MKSLAPLRLLGLVVLLAAWGAIANAACSNPTAAEGSINYDISAHAFRFCDDTNTWASFGGGTLATLTDTTISNVAGRDYLRYDAGASKWVNVSESMAMSTTTMVNGWPDAIKCTSSTRGETVLYFGPAPFTDGKYYYFESNSGSGTAYYAAYNSNGTYYSNGGLGTLSNCNSTISALYAAGRAFNFIGSAASSGGTPAGSSGDIQFNDGSGFAADTGQLFWDATYNRLGIGTGAPISALQVSGTLEVGGTGASMIEMGRNSVGNQNSYIDMVSDDTYSDYGLRIIRSNAGPDANSALQHRGLGVLYLMTQEAAPIRFYTSTTVRMDIGANGNVGIGTTSPNAKLEVAGEISASGVISNYTGSGGQFRAVYGNYGFLTRLDGNNVYWLLTNSGDAYGGWNALRPMTMGVATGNLSFGNGALQVQHAGNVGVGVGAPEGRLDIRGVGTTNVDYADGDSLSATVVVRDTGVAGNNGGQVLFGAGQGLFAGIKGELRHGTGPAGNLSFLTRDQGTGDLMRRMVVYHNGNVGIGIANTVVSVPFGLFVSGTIGVSSSLGALVMYDRSVGMGMSQLYRMNNLTRIWDSTGGDRVAINNTTGNVGIGTTNPIAKLDVVGNVSATGGISATGSVQAYAFLHPSDRRLKKDIRTLTEASAILEKLRGTHFTWKASNQPAYGLIAQEVRTILPELVPQGDGTLTVDYDQLTAILIEGWKQQQKAIGELKAANDNLEAANDNQEKAIERLEQRIRKLEAGGARR